MPLFQKHPPWSRLMDPNNFEKVSLALLGFVHGTQSNKDKSDVYWIVGETGQKSNHCQISDDYGSSVG